MERKKREAEVDGFDRRSDDGLDDEPEDCLDLLNVRNSHKSPERTPSFLKSFRNIYIHEGASVLHPIGHSSQKHSQGGRRGRGPLD